MKNRLVLPFLLFLSSLAWYWAWPPGPFPWLLFILLIPLIYLADDHHENTAIAEPWIGRISLLCFFYCLISESMGIFWISRFNFLETLVPIFLGALTKTLAILFLKKAWKKTHTQFIRNLGSLGFIGLWVILEWVKENIFSYPWMNLGMGLSSVPRFIQWYEYTGILGGTFWILALNLLGYELMKSAFALNNPSKSSIRYRFLIWAGLFIAPSLASFMRYESYSDFRNRHYNRTYAHAVHMVLVQSNLNPYTEKFDSALWKDQLKNFLNMSKASAKPNTEYIIWPETALEPWHGLNEDLLAGNRSLLKIRHFLVPYKNASLVTGALTYRIMEGNPSPFRKPENGTPSDTLWYNSAIQVGNDENIEVYHKQVLVPGVEKSPLSFGYSTSPRSQKPMLYLGGIQHYFSQDGNSKILYSQSGLGLGVLICFESAFGHYARKLCLKGAGILAILSNDAWWGNSSEPYQHRDYARILAIENRRSLAQSSNGGISFFIGERGEILNEIPLATQGSMGASLDINEDLTFYTQYGDWMLYACLIFFLFSSAYLLVPGLKKTN
jgi:apolipoprotein N-acyltransferase